MSHWTENWELVVGLEVHAQLLTESKAYSNDPNAYGDHPNTNVSVVSLGMPGVLLGWSPMLRRKVRARAQAGLARYMAELQSHAVAHEKN